MQKDYKPTSGLNVGGRVVLWAVLFCMIPAMGASELPLPDVVPQLAEFRLAATVSPEAAFGQYAIPGVAARMVSLGSVLCPASDPMKGWGTFFGTSIGTMTSLTEEVVLTMFYNPWADVALLCEWQTVCDRPMISDVELVCGDVLRKSKELDLTPLWRRAGEIPPPLSVMVSANDSVHAFLDLYGKRSIWGGENWRKKLTLLKKKENAEANSQVVGFLFNQVLASVGGFFNDPQLAGIRSAMDEVRDLLIAGKTDAVLAMAPETSSDSRMILEKAPLQWESGTVVLLATDMKNAFVFMADLRHPEHYGCFWFVKTAGNGAALRRIDFLSHTLSFAEVDTIARQAGMKRP